MYEVELPFEVDDRLLYYFSETPLRNDRRLERRKTYFTWARFETARLILLPDGRRCDRVVTVR